MVPRDLGNSLSRALLAAALLTGACRGSGAHGAAGASAGKPNGGLTCGSGSRTPLPLDASGWVPASSNPYCIQGAWSWTSDAQTGGKTIVTGLTSNSPPFVAGSGMCLSGSTSAGAADNYKTWGASLQLNLSQATPTGMPVPLVPAPPCFTITITGSGAPGGLTASLCPPSSDQSAVCPQVALQPGANEVCITDVTQPSWCGSTSSTGQVCLPPSELGLGIQSVGVEANSGAGGAIDFCVSSIVPHGYPPSPDAGNDAALDSGPTATAGLIAARPYTLHVPPSYDPRRPTPLLVMLHGYSADGPSAESTIFRLTAASDRNGFLYALPNGTVDSTGNRFWNATDACCEFDPGSNVDDVTYLNAVLDDIESKYTVDLEQVFVGGHSNGAMMAQVFACRSADRIAAVFSYAGALWADTSLCQPSSVVSIVELHGDLDINVPYAGGPNADYPTSRAYPSAAVTVGTWAALDHCAGSLTDDGQSFDLVPALAGSETTVQKSARCPPGVDAELWTIRGGAHVDTLSADTFGALVWSFLHGHPKPKP